MPDATVLVETIKKAAVDAVQAEKPAEVCFGKVIAISPLKIQVDQKLILTKAQLILARNVTEFTINVSMQWKSEISLGDHNHGLSLETQSGGSPSHSHGITGNTEDTNLAHNHEIKGKKAITIHNGLVVGDEVILLRQQGGQKYIVLDRLK